VRRVSAPSLEDAFVAGIGARVQRLYTGRVGELVVDAEPIDGPDGEQVALSCTDLERNRLTKRVEIRVLLTQESGVPRVEI
jgi:hypothetical protein